MPEVSRGTAAFEAESEQSPTWLIIAVGLLVVRWLLPAESTASGATLWLVGGWLLLAAIWTLSRLRDWSITPLALDRIDLAIILLVTPQLVSALLLVVTSDGNARSAANMGCEWIGLLVSFVLLRRWLREPAGFQAVARLALAVAVGISILGIWQHHVGYRRAIVDFDRLETELATATRTGDTSTVRQFQSELAAAGIPLDGPARQLWERRLRDSREPYAFFALANTLGGLLATLLLLGLALCPAAWRSRAGSGARLALFLVGLLLVAYCLLLTKSRTAWIGFVAGGTVLVGGNLWRVLRERPRLSALVAGAPLLLVTTAVLSGGIDREVLTEAPKSLAYRFEYWQGSLGVISSRPLTGTGPGNFRQHYLAHKLEGSSEEIADPHSFVLEATATAGVLGLLGLAACVVLLMSRWRQPDDESASGTTANDEPGARTLIGGVGGFMLALAPGWLLGGDFDVRLVGVLAGFGVAWFCLPRVTLDRRTQRRVALAAMVALLVHLSAAGGFSRPALMQLVLLMLIGCFPWSNRGEQPGTSNDTATRKSARVTAIGCCLAFIAVSLLGLLPVFRQSTVGQTATNALFSGRPANATRLLRDAQQVDRLDPTPTRRLAHLLFDRATSDPANDEFLDQGVDAATNTSRRDPHNWAAAHDLARAFRLRWQSRRDDADRQAMIDWGTTAVDRYPSNPRLHAWLAMTLAEAGQDQPAQQEAETTLRLHDLLKLRGHVDKLLSDERLEQMRALISSP